MLSVVAELLINNANWSSLPHDNLFLTCHIICSQIHYFLPGIRKLAALRDIKSQNLRLETWYLQDRDETEMLHFAKPSKPRWDWDIEPSSLRHSIFPISRDRDYIPGTECSYETLKLVMPLKIRASKQSENFSWLFLLLPTKVLSIVHSELYQLTFKTFWNIDIW